MKASKATFKILACGAIWDDKKNGESDDWGTYMHERAALFNFIAKQRIGGVILMGGDIHVSRALRYPTEKSVGYPIHQFIVSPMHHSTIKSLNVPHPALIRDALEPNVFMKLVADTTAKPATLTATWINKDGKEIFDVRTDARVLASR